MFDYNYYVENKTSDNIIVIYETGNGVNIKDTVSVIKNERKLIYISDAAGGKKLLGQDVSIVFDRFIIKKGDLESQKNYRDNQIWEYKEISDTVGEYTLLVDSSHF